MKPLREGKSCGFKIFILYLGFLYCKIVGNFGLVRNAGVNCISYRKRQARWLLEKKKRHQKMAAWRKI